MMIAGFYRASAAGKLVVCLVLAALPAHATETAIEENFPASPAVAITIDSENLIDLHQSVPDLRIVDARFYEDYVLGHIELSRNLPIHQTDCAALAQIADDRNTAMVFYGNGGEQGASVDAIEVASACGYQRLFWFRGGFIEWQDKDYPYVIE